MTVEIGPPLLTTAAADIILQGLPRLQQAQLRVVAEAAEAADEEVASEPWRLKVGASTDLLEPRL
jgi:hypothetical protein